MLVVFFEVALVNIGDVTFVVMRFELALAEEKVKRQQVIALHLIVVFTLLIFGAFLLIIKSLLAKLPLESQASVQLASVPSGAGIILLLLGFGLLGLLFFKGSWLLEKKVNRALRTAELLLVLLLTSFSVLHQIWMPAIIFGIVAAAILFAIYWESISDNTLYIEVNERGIRLPVNAGRRFLHWGEVQNVLLRFGVMTIDCYDNRLFQWNIKSTNFEKEQFQRFCLDQIVAHKERKAKYAW